MVAWPASLPQFFERNGYQEALPDVLLRTQMDAGPAKVRRRTTAGVRMIRGRIRCTSSQVDSFETLFNTDLAGGSIPFDWVHPRTQAATSFRFVSPPQYESLGGDQWRVLLDLEVLP